MSIDFLPYVFDAADHVWAIAPGCEPDNALFDINMCNSNALDVLEALGFRDMSFSAEVVPIEEFLDRTTRALRGSIARPSPAMGVRTSQADYGVATIIGGRVEGYIQKRLHQLAVMARESRTHGATHIGWG